MVCSESKREVAKATVEVKALVLPVFPQANPYNIRLMPGTITTIIGPNGAGKTSLLKAISGELQAVSGKVLLNNRLIADWPARKRACHCAVLPQQSTLNFSLSVEEVVRLARQPHATGAAYDELIVDTVLAQMDATGLRSRSYTSLSGGEKQRVQIARVLGQIWRCESAAVGAAPVLLMDEPLNSLDLAHQQLLLRTLKEMNMQGAAVCLVVHDLNIAAAIADQVLLLDHGELVAQGDVLSVLTPGNIREVFGVDVAVVTETVTGRPTLTFSSAFSGDGYGS